MKKLVVVFFVFFFACERTESQYDQAISTSSSFGDSLLSVDVLYTNGIIWTGVDIAADKQEETTVFAIAAGKIVFVGKEIPNNIDAAITVDLNGRFVMPGFIDNHVHLFDGGAGLASVDLRDASTPEEFSRRIVAHAAALPDERWILIGNWDHELWGGELPRKEWIDAGTQDVPVFVMRLDGHMALANSAALKLAGIDRASVAPDGGEIIRDESGDPTGLLKDAAMNAVFDVIPTPTEEETLEIFNLAQDHALSVGLTEVHVLIGYPHETQVLSQLQRIREQGAMKIRIHMYSPIEDWKNTKVLVEREGNGDDFLRWGGQKAFVDGSLGSTTAWFYDPYSDQPGEVGFPLVDPALLKERLAAADKAGLRIAVHAIGDKAIDQAIRDLRAIAGENIAGRRFRIEHFQHPSRNAIAAIAKYRIIASMHPYHAIDDGRWAQDRLGPERIQTTYAFRSILDAGGILSFGSDWPVAPLAPLEGVYAAVTRATTDGANPDGWLPHEKITVEEALRAYTSANAYSGFEEEHAGTLETGKRADFVILSEDPRKVDPSDIRNVKVLSTYINGQMVYEASELN